MLKRPFRHYHLLQLLEAYSAQSLPLDCVVHDYFRSHRALGAGDRRFIGDAVFGLVRWQGLLDGLGANGEWEQRWELWQKLDPWSCPEAVNLPLYARWSIPEKLFLMLTERFGEQRAIELAQQANERAPTTVRVNRLKGEREELIAKWSDLEIKTCELSDVGLMVPTGTALLQRPEFREGWFELQDEGSQLVAQQVAVKPGDLVLDYCAGAGGKSLAIGAEMRNKGQLFLHDVRRSALRQARRRLNRAGVQNAQFLEPDDRRLKHLKGRIDWVLLDVPCSGTGTWRRNVDMKWRFELTQVTELQQTQEAVVAEALSYVRPGGRLVYATCSLLPDENEQQVERFQERWGLQPVGQPFASWPHKGGMDGFFAVVLAP